MRDLTLKDLLPVIRYGARPGVVVFSAVFVISLFTMFLMAPQYEVSTTILIEQEDPSALMLPNPAALLIGSMQGMQNETELIKSRAVIDTLVDRLNMQFPVEPRHDSFFTHFIGRFGDRPEFMGAPYFSQVHPGLEGAEGSIRSAGDGYHIENGSEAKDCLWDKPCRFLGGEVTLSRVGIIPDGEMYDFSHRSYVKARKFVRDAYDAFPLGDAKSSTLFRITMQASSTPFAALFLNELVRIFSEKKVLWRTESTETTRGFLEKLSVRLKEERDEKLRKLTLFMSNSRTILPDEQVKGLVAQKMDLERQKKELDIRKNLIAEFSKTAATAGDRMLPIPMLDDDKALGEVVATYNMLVMQEKKATELFLDTHPDLIMLRQQLAATRATIGKMADDSEGHIARVEALLNEKLGEMDSEMRRLPPELSELAVLKAEQQAVDKIYWFLNEKLYENEIKKESMKHDIRIVDPADPREEKIFPRISISLILAFSLAVLMALCMVFARYFLRRTVAFGEEVPRIIGETHRWTALPHTTDATIERLDDPLLRLLIAGGTLEKRPSVIALCAVQSGDGVSFIAERIARLLSERGYRVALSTDTPPDKTPREDTLHRFEFSPDRLAHADNTVQEKLRSLRDTHDFVIVNLPPMIRSVDAELLAGTATDTVLLVVRAGRTPRSLLYEKYRQLADRIRSGEGTILVAVNESPSPFV